MLDRGVAPKATCSIDRAVDGAPADNHAPAWRVGSAPGPTLLAAGVARRAGRDRALRIYQHFSDAVPVSVSPVFAPVLVKLIKTQSLSAPAGCRVAVIVKAVVLAVTASE